jgi:pimeloyl-ACP methyl ester carboxylesterase
VTSPDLDHYLETSLNLQGARLKAGVPVLCMVHGFLYDPRQIWQPDPADSDNPHCRLYHFKDLGEASEIREHTTGWPLQLEFAENDRGVDGLCVAFGWHSQPGFASSLLERFQNFYARAYDYATETAWPLVLTLRGLTRLIRDRPIDIFCHSMGSTVVIRALAIAAKYRFPLVDRIGRVIMLGGSEYSGEANILYKRMMEHVRERKLKRNQGPYVYNVVSRENDILDKLAENFGPKSFFTDSQVVGHNGLEAAKGAERWIDLQIDGGQLRRWTKRVHGLDISGDQPGNIWDHWYYYTHRGNMAMYRKILRERAAWSFETLRAKKNGGPAPEGVAVGFFGD